MNKYLITGFSGFVSKHFLDFLEIQEKDARILGIDIHLPDYSINEYINIKCHYEQVDMLDKDKLEKVISLFRPDYILHLASNSSVAYSWKNPLMSFTNNTNIFLNLLEVIRLNNIKCRILSVGSSEEYGNVNQENIPLVESFVVEPVSPYAVARVSQEMLSKVYTQGFNLDIIMTRSFNHIGPGQKDIFVVSSFAKQLVALQMKKLKQGEIKAGDTSIIRDFIDVRDVVKAYYLLFKKGYRGEIYNVCSGQGIILIEIIHKMSEKLKLDITIKHDSLLKRPNDNRIIIGSNNKIKIDTGWDSNISIDKSIDDILDYWKKKHENFIHNPNS